MKLIMLFSAFVLDIDECSKNGSPCDENADCLNNDGSYTCTCKDGFTGNGTVCVGKFPIANRFCLRSNACFSFIRQFLVFGHLKTLTKTSVLLAVCRMYSF